MNDCRAERLQDVDAVKSMLNGKKAENPEWYQKRLDLLDQFFSERLSPVDIAVILDSGFIHTYLLADYIGEDNLLFYRPKASKIKKIKEAFLEGQVHPERTLLLFDSDMMEGDTMREASLRFINEGYSRDKIFCYLNFGCRSREYGVPELMHVDDTLREKAK